MLLGMVQPLKGKILAILILVLIPLTCWAFSPAFHGMMGMGSGNPELHTTAAATTDPNGNEVNGTGNWTNGNNTTVISSIEDPYAGNYALKAVSNDGSYDRTEISITVVSGKSYRVTF